jgi:hypothetical protein
MEPSIRSSSYRVKECSLRKTQPALHDAAKRLVESHFSDTRISQYADLEFAIKKMENNTWYWLDPLSSGRQGFLIFQEKQPIVWMDDQMKFSYTIPIRVSPTLSTKPSIFLASLSRPENILRVEDCWLLSGSPLKTPFTQRWEKVLDFFLSYYHFDSHLQQGLVVSCAEYKPLSAAKTWTTTPQMMLAQGETYPRRLRVQFIKQEQDKKPNPILPTPISQSSYQQPHKQHHNKEKEKKPTRALFLIDQIDSKEESQVDNSIAKAIPHPEYPDTYDIWMNGQKKGYAAVQDIELSRRLRKLEMKEIPVKVEWNTEFNMYEILAIIS